MLKIIKMSAAVLSVIAGSTAAQATVTKQPVPQIKPSMTEAQARDQLASVILIRQTLMALQQANESGNYEVFREIASPRFRQIASTEQLSKNFAPMRASKVDLGLATVTAPKLMRSPTIGKDGNLDILGSMATTKGEFKYHLVYEPVASRWRLSAIAVDLVPMTASVKAKAQTGR